MLLLTACCSSSFCGRAATSPERFSAFKRVFSKRANLKERHPKSIEGCLQTKTRPLDSGGYSLGLSGPVLTVPPWCESTLYKRRCFLLGLARGASIADICKAAGWATPNKFARFYNLRIEPVSSRVLVLDGR